MTSPSETAVIAIKSLLPRRKLKAGLVVPDKAFDDGSELLMATAKRQAVISRLSCVASSVAMHLHRFAPNSLSAKKAQLVTAVSEGEVMS